MRETTSLSALIYSVWKVPAGFMHRRSGSGSGSGCDPGGEVDQIVVESKFLLRIVIRVRSLTSAVTIVTQLRLSHKFETMRGKRAVLAWIHGKREWAGPRAQIQSPGPVLFSAAITGQGSALAVIWTWTLDLGLGSMTMGSRVQSHHPQSLISCSTYLSQPISVIAHHPPRMISFSSCVGIIAPTY